MTTALHVDVNPALLVWACERAGIAVEEMASKLKAFSDWMHGTRKPTLKQLEAFAHTTHVPMGYFFLPGPPDEGVPIPDFRTVGSRALARPSGNLLDVIYACQRRQDWYREFALSTAQEPLAFVASADLASDPDAVAARMRTALGFDLDERRRLRSWEEALRLFIDRAEAIGVLVMVSGVVANNTHRPLDPEEFRGFALADDLAPLIFLNGADSKAAQMFTLAHELAHLWLGESGVSDVGPASRPARRVETWCNRAAAELLVPLAALEGEYRAAAGLSVELPRLAREFKVSTLVILRRIFDAGHLSEGEFAHAYAQELARLGSFSRAPGGSFYRTQAARVGKRFARALVTDTLAGQTLYRDALSLLGMTKIATFEAFGAEIGVL